GAVSRVQINFGERLMRRKDQVRRSRHSGHYLIGCPRRVDFRLLHDALVEFGSLKEARVVSWTNTENGDLPEPHVGGVDVGRVARVGDVVNEKDVEGVHMGGIGGG